MCVSEYMCVCVETGGGGAGIQEVLHLRAECVLRETKVKKGDREAGDDLCPVVDNSRDGGAATSQDWTA